MPWTHDPYEWFNPEVGRTKHQWSNEAAPKVRPYRRTGNGKPAPKLTPKPTPEQETLFHAVMDHAKAYGVAATRERMGYLRIAEIPADQIPVVRAKFL